MENKYSIKLMIMRDKKMNDVVVPVNTDADIYSIIEKFLVDDGDTLAELESKARVYEKCDGGNVVQRYGLIIELATKKEVTEQRVTEFLAEKGCDFKIVH